MYVGEKYERAAHLVKRLEAVFADQASKNNAKIEVNPKGYPAISLTWDAGQYYDLLQIYYSDIADNFCIWVCRQDRSSAGVRKKFIVYDTPFVTIESNINAYMTDAIKILENWRDFDK